jgi:DNA processing protein
MCAKTISPACRHDVTIVSGLALGIDTVAHLTALEQHSHTIAVLAAGVDSIYPPQNRELAKKIIDQGALVSEYEPGSKLEKWNFPARNRIVSALSQAVYVVEGPLSSGALLTAKFAIEQDRELLALPGEINHPNAQGPNYLIKSGARLISCPEDVLEALGIDADTDQQMQLLPELSDSEQGVWDIFQSEQRELSFDDLIIKTGLSFGKLSIILLNLELKGCIGKASGNSFVPR